MDFILTEGAWENAGFCLMFWMVLNIVNLEIVII